MAALSERDRDRTLRLPKRSLPGSGGSRSITPVSLPGANNLSLTDAVSQSPAPGAAAAAGFPAEMALAESAGSWRRDRITLSLEAQVIMMEMKTTAKDSMELAAQAYANGVSQMKVSEGRYVFLESFGGYRLRWKN